MLDKEVTDCAAEAESLSVRFSIPFSFVSHDFSAHFSMFQKQREYLERALDDAENNLQEFLKQK
jgi:hypothetical protein